MNPSKKEKKNKQTEVSDKEFIRKWIWLWERSKGPKRIFRNKIKNQSTCNI